MTRILATTEATLLAFDGDTAEGREGIREAFGEYELDAKVWLPFAARTYNISPNIEDYIISVTPICPADLPNANGIGFPLSELTRFQPVPTTQQVYKAWTGTPLHTEHQNEDYTKALGVVLDTSLHKIKGYGQGKLWKVMGLAALDKNRAPDIAADMLARRLRTFSMGADAGFLTCSVCQRILGQSYKCGHVDEDNDMDFNVVTHFDGTQELAFRNAHDLRPIKLSVVRDPAWSIALSDTLLQT